MKAALLLLVVALSVLGSFGAPNPSRIRVPRPNRLDFTTEFDAFLVQFNKSYSGAEYKTRLGYFTQHMLTLERQKASMLAAGQTSWTVGVTQFFDLSRAEFQLWAGGRKYPAEQLAISCLAHGVTTPALDASANPTNFTWLDRNPPIVNPIKNQGQCGSCWAFSTIGSIESRFAVLGNKLQSFSEQEIVDCSHGCSLEPPYGQVCNQGCDGGWQWNAFEDVMMWKGVELEANYPYMAVTQTCKGTNTPPVDAPITNYTCLSTPAGNVADEVQMATYMIANGPISIAMDAGILESYTGGIINPAAGDCSQVQLDHAIIIVGYGEEAGLDFWIVRNSWGTTWGEKGYFRIVRGVNACGLAAAVSAPLMS